MEGNYIVYFGNSQCGKVQVLRQGLYWRFVCRCRLSSDILCRLLVDCGGVREDLGILVPMDGGFGLDKKIPAKRLGEGIPSFRITAKSEQSQGKFVPICPEEPFSYIARLKESYLVYRNDQAGILVR